MELVGRRRSDVRSRAGLTLGEAVLIAAIIFVGALFVLMALPRSRESARLAGCQRNLSQIGVALLQYGRIQERYPQIDRYEPLAESPGPPQSDGPLRSLLTTLQLPDFTELTVVEKRLDPRPGSVPGAVSVRGFVCSSDPRATAGGFTAPISYRGSTGGNPLQPDGLFTLGRGRSPAEIEAGDGAAFTAAFAERLVGTGSPGRPALENYRATSAPVPSDGCPPGAADRDFRGDAGSSWVRADYRSTLYNHALPPNAPASCIAEDGRSAFMGASSGHTAGVNLLLLDGSLRTIRPTVDSKIWRGFGTIDSARSTP